MDIKNMTREEVKAAMDKIQEKIMALRGNPTLWGDGPWITEPLGKDPIDMTYKGYDCAFRRNLYVGGNWVGYIGVTTAESRWAKKNDVYLHGGITYSEATSKEKTYPSLKIRQNNKMVIGFDCAHAEDITPYMDAFNKIMWGQDSPLANKSFLNLECRDYWKPTYKTLEFCQNSAREFIDELIKMKLAKSVKQA